MDAMESINKRLTESVFAMNTMVEPIIDDHFDSIYVIQSLASGMFL